MEYYNVQSNLWFNFDLFPQSCSCFSVYVMLDVNAVFCFSSWFAKMCHLVISPRTHSHLDALPSIQTRFLPAPILSQSSPLLNKSTHSCLTLMAKAITLLIWNWGESKFCDSYVFIVHFNNTNASNSRALLLFEPSSCHWVLSLWPASTLPSAERGCLHASTDVLSIWGRAAGYVFSWNTFSWHVFLSFLWRWHSWR